MNFSVGLGVRIEGMKSSERLLPETNGERELMQIHEDHWDSHSSTSRLDVGSWRTLGRARTYLRAALEHRPAHTARARTRRRDMLCLRTCRREKHFH